MDGKGKGSCTIRRVPADADAIRRWYETLNVGLKYEGEGLPHASNKALLALLKPQRETLPAEEKEQLYHKQGGSCAYCGEQTPLKKLESDHVVPLSEGGGNASSNWQLLCRSCHVGKTNEEQGRICANPLLSRFAPAEYERA